MSNIDFTFLNDCLQYEESTGNLIWKKSISSRYKIGSIAGFKKKDGYIRIRLLGKSYLAHRIIWFYVYKQWPNGVIDHINRNKSDNRLINLRVVNIQQNTHNQRNPQKGNKSGYLGVSWNKTDCAWRANIAIKGRQILIGKYKTAEEASQAYFEAKKIYHPSAPVN
jgi:hypothetical protein